MASIKDIPFAQIKNVAESFKTNEADRHSCVRIAIVLDGEVEQELALALKQALTPESSTGLINVGTLRAGEPLRVNPDCDLAIVLAGSGHQALGAARAFAAAKVPCAVCVESSVAVEADDVPESCALICAATPKALLSKLASWMVSACNADIALAANFSFVRAAVTKKCISDKAAQNALVGVLPFGNGADMPVMAANQFLMSLDVASAHGKGSSTERVAAGASIIGASFASRGIARALVKKLPGLGWAVRGAVGYGATYAIGKALQAAYVVQDAWKTRQ